MMRKCMAVVFVIIIFSGLWYATSIAEYRYIFDFASVINPSDKVLIENYVEAVSDLGIGHCIVITQKTKEFSEEQGMAIAVSSPLGVIDDEAMIVIYLFTEDRYVVVKPSQMINARITGAMCDELIDEYAIPLLKQNDYSGGLTSLVKATCLKYVLSYTPLFDDVNLINALAE